MQHSSPAKQSSFSPLSAISSFLPKIEAGLGTKPKDSDFDDDPFFAGFKRSLQLSAKNLEAQGMKADSISLLGSPEETKPVRRLTRKGRAAFLKRMSSKLERVSILRIRNFGAQLLP
jgi:hypothetical protein